MKPTAPAPNPVPRLNSLLHRLRQTPGPEDEPSCLDQLMIFLDDPPPGVTDRWKEGAAMCASWGIACSGASVWRLYRSHAVEWRAHLALQVDLAPAGQKIIGSLVSAGAAMLTLNPGSR